MKLSELKVPQSGHPYEALAGALIYTGLSALCATAWQKSRRAGGVGAGLWGLLALLQLFLAADALLGIRLGIAELGREFFKDHGWYGQRKPFQAVLSAAAMLAVAAGGWWIWRHRRVIPRGCRWAMAGTLFSLLPFLIACVSMHFFEDVMNWPGGPVGLGALLRVIGCVFAGVGVGSAIRATGKKDPTSS